MSLTISTSPASGSLCPLSQDHRRSSSCSSRAENAWRRAWSAEGQQRCSQSPSITSSSCIPLRQRQRSRANSPESVSAGPIVLNSSDAAPRQHHFLDFGNGIGRIEPLGAGPGTVHDGVTAIQLEGGLKLLEPITRGFVTRIEIGRAHV